LVGIGHRFLKVAFALGARKRHERARTMILEAVFGGIY
jgi:hypothetical protein